MLEDYGEKCGDGRTVKPVFAFFILNSRDNS